jgi:hypothetical protein
VEGGEFADDGAGEGSGSVGWAGEGHDAGATQGDHHRGVGEAGRAADELPCGSQELRVELHEWVGGSVEADGGGQWDWAAADSGRKDVVVGGAALPQPVGALDGGPQHGQVGMDVLGGGELGRGQVVGLECGLVEVAEVAGSFAAPGAAGHPPFDQAKGEAGRHRDDGRAGHQGDQPGRARAWDREQERQRPSAADQRHQVLEPAGRARGIPGDRRRGRNRQLAGRNMPGVRPHRPAHHDAGRSTRGPGKGRVH